LIKKPKIIAQPSVPPASTEPLPPSPPLVKSKRKFYAILGLTCIAILVFALVLIFFVPRGLGETIPYSFNYVVGEKMAYNMSVTVTGTGQSASETGTVEIDVLSFDGANYTLNETTSLTTSGQTQRFSYLVMMNKSGQMVNISNLPSQMQQMDMLGMRPGFGFPSNKTEARVGETWQLPLDLNNSEFNMSGTLNYRFGDIQNFTVPAGTYKAFMIEASTDNIYASAADISVSMNMDGQLHLEYGTCRLLDMNMHATETVTGTQTITMSMNIQMQLTQHFKP